MSAIGEHLEVYTFEYLINQALSKVPDTVDKREGSIIYDALAPLCYALAESYMNLRYFYEDTYILTATGIYLDFKVQELGVRRYPATAAIRRGTFTGEDGAPFNVEVGSRFSTIVNDPSDALIYVVKEKYQEQRGVYQLECETPSIIGNSYIGQLLPVTHINGLATAYMDTLIQPGQEQENDEELRERYLYTVNNRPFGGNIAQYKEELKSMNGVGGVQVYSVWNGGGTVLLSVVDSEHNACSDDFLDILREEVDPENHKQEGLGFAPIGHYVTITTPQEIAIDITTNVTLRLGYSIGQVEEQIKEAIQTLLSELRADWDVTNDYINYYTTVYISQINAYILRITGVANVTHTLINGKEEDVVLEQSAEKQQIPVLGEVVLNVG